VITWHPTGVADACTAHVSVGAVTVARLHARVDRWELEHLGGRESGPANSVPQAKRAALQALRELLATAAFDVDVALRSV
jgi:hypothetical protein